MCNWCSVLFFFFLTSLQASPESQKGYKKSFKQNEITTYRFIEEKCILSICIQGEKGVENSNTSRGPILEKPESSVLGHSRRNPGLPSSSR